MRKKKKIYNAKWSAILIVSLLILLISVFYVFQWNKEHEKSLKENLESNEHLSLQMLQMYKEQRFTVFYKSRITSFTNFPEVKEGMFQKNKTILKDFSLKKFQILQEENPYFFSINFFLADGSCFLKITSEGIFDVEDFEINPISQSIQTKKQITGFKIDEFGSLFSVNQAVFLNGRYVGFVEFCIRTKQILEALEKDPDHQTMIFFLSDEFKRATKATCEKLQIGEYTLITGQSPFFKKLAKEVKIEDKNQRIKLDHDFYHVHPHLLFSDTTGKEIGGIIIINKITEKILAKEFFLKQSILMTLFLIILSFLILFFSFKALFDKIEQQKEELQTARDNLEKDVQIRTQELERSEKLYRTLTENSITGIWQIRKNGQTIYINPAMRKMLAEQKIGDKTFDSFFTPKSLSIIAEKFSNMLEGQNETFEVELIDNKQEEHQMVVSASPIFSKEGILESYMGTFTDITELKKAQEEVEKSSQATIKTYERFFYTLGDFIETRSQETAKHLPRVTELTHILALKLAETQAEAHSIRIASIMHDCGKIAIPKEILLKPGKLTPEEFKTVQKHTIIGARFWEGYNSPLVDLARKIARYHHERWDGTGYPDRLKAKEIPLAARMVAIADVFDALISERCYKKAWSFEEAVKEITSQKGKQFDPELVDLFLENLPEIKQKLAIIG